MPIRWMYLISIQGSWCTTSPTTRSSVSSTTKLPLWEDWMHVMGDGTRGITRRRMCTQPSSTRACSRGKVSCTSGDKLPQLVWRRPSQTTITPASWISMYVLSFRKVG
jgi:hypothetical protein